MFRGRSLALRYSLKAAKGLPRLRLTFRCLASVLPRPRDYYLGFASISMLWLWPRLLFLYVVCAFPVLAILSPSHFQRQSLEMSSFLSHGSQWQQNEWLVKSFSPIGNQRVHIISYRSSEGEERIASWPWFVHHIRSAIRQPMFLMRSMVCPSQVPDVSKATGMKWNVCQLWRRRIPVPSALLYMQPCAG